MTGATLLLADDDAAIRTVLTQYLQQQGFEVRACDSGAALWQWVQSGLGEVAITDVVMPDVDGLDLLPKIRQTRPDLPVIVMSAKNTVLTALSASERGAFDYLPKPFDLHVLADTVNKALQGRQAAQDDRDASSEQGLDLPIVGSSAVMQGVYRLIAKLAPTDLTVLIRGESGTGKELVAKVLHEFGPRRTRSFVALNMAAIPADLVESELFGYERGAFTGADARKDGRFAGAEGGTLFLDEIGDMPLPIQTRLLRVLQEGTYTRVGGMKDLRTDVRIIAATHRDLEAMVAEGTFREDLFYRLNVVPIVLPPLRDRLEDMAELVPMLAQGLASAHVSAKIFTPEALNAMAAHSWPGNVRELENFIQRLMAVVPGAQIDANTVHEALGTSKGGVPASLLPIDTPNLDAQAALAAAVQRFFGEDERPHLTPGQAYAQILAALERPLIERTLRLTKGNQIQAAAFLGLNRNTLRKKVRDLGIRVVRGLGSVDDQKS